MAQNQAATAEYTKQVSTANLRASQLEVQLAASAARIDQLEEFVRVQGQTAATRMENIDQVNLEVSRLRGQIEVIQFELSALKEELTAYQIQQERRQLHDENRLQQIEKFLGVKPPPPPTDAEMGLTTTSTPGDEPPVDGPLFDPTAEPAPDDTPPTARGKLDLASEHMAAGRQGVARAVLTKAAAEHPDSEEIAEIRYRLAETHLNEKNHGKAALAFKAVIDDYPTSPWASWSMLRQGECFEGLGQNDNARLFFDGVIQRYPKSDAAKEAKKKLGR